MNEQTMNQEEMQQPIQKPFYKKWWVWAIAVVVVIVAIAMFSGGDAVQDDLLDYINNDTNEMVELDAEVIELYEKAQNSANDYTMYEILMNEVIPKSKELIEEAESIEIETSEVKKVHEIYLDAINKNTVNGDVKFSPRLCAVDALFLEEHVHSDSFQHSGVL